MALLKLKALPAYSIEGHRIEVYDKANEKLGTVYINANFVPTANIISHTEMREIINVLENFSLFYDNLYEAKNEKV